MDRKRVKLFEDEKPHAVLKLDLPRSYHYSWQFNDLVAGFLVFTVTVPAALAYGEMAGPRGATASRPFSSPWEEQLPRHRAPADNRRLGSCGYSCGFILALLRSLENFFPVLIYISKKISV